MNMNNVGDYIEINENNLPSGIVYKYLNLINNMIYWHKFKILNVGKLKRNTILRAILDHVHPLDLIPVSYSKSHGVSSFLARNCGAAINKLANDNLTIPNPEDPSKPFKVVVVLKFATTNEFKVDVQKNIMNVLIKRFDVTTKRLDLSNFHEDKGLSEFCPLSQPKILFFVIHLSKNLTPQVEQYNLSNNQIKLLNPMEALTGVRGVTYLDLSNNCIEKCEDLAPLKVLTDLTELILDKNPLCDTIDSSFQYVAQVQQHCPKLTLLDGILVKEGMFPIVKQTFICSPSDQDVVNQFLQYFFTVYDSKNRMALEGLYHNNAMFSLTACYIPSQISSSTAQLRTYNIYSRNLSKLADFSRNSEYLFKGSLTIMKIFSQLPPTEHDPYSFKVDVVFSTSKCIVINVNGAFRELPQNLLDVERYLGFTRTFALEMVKDGDNEAEWCIVNELLHVYNALNVQITSSFKTPKPVNVDTILVAKSSKDCKRMVDTLKIITNLNRNYSTKCLEECNYDLKKALMLFVDLYKVDRIPPEAFLTNK